LERHPDREREVGKIKVGGQLVVEVDAADRLVVVVPGVAQHVDGMQRGPGEHDARDRQSG
jgi:hypothetical protein